MQLVMMKHRRVPHRIGAKYPSIKGLLPFSVCTALNNAAMNIIGWSGNRQRIKKKSNEASSQKVAGAAAGV
ncbi:MAG: hypothetical protein ACRYGL_17320 [Janthinobacterium lividum]